MCTTLIGIIVNITDMIPANWVSFEMSVRSRVWRCTSLSPAPGMRRWQDDCELRSASLSYLSPGPTFPYPNHFNKIYPEDDFYNRYQVIRVGHYLVISCVSYNHYFFLAKSTAKVPLSITIIHVIACARFYHSFHATDYIYIEFLATVSEYCILKPQFYRETLDFLHCPNPTASTSGDIDRKSFWPGHLHLRGRTLVLPQQSCWEHWPHSSLSSNRVLVKELLSHMATHGGAPD